MQIERLAEGLGAAEGPAFLPDGRFIFVEIWRSRVSVWTSERGVELLAHVGGGPNSVLVCSDGSLLVTQSGGVERDWRAKDRRPPSIQRVSSEGDVDLVATEIEGIPLGAPNDLAFGADGKLYFTDPAGGFSRTRRRPPGYISHSIPTGPAASSPRQARRSRTGSRSRPTGTSSGSSRSRAPSAGTTSAPARSRRSASWRIRTRSRMGSSRQPTATCTSRPCSPAAYRSSPRTEPRRGC